MITWGAPQLSTRGPHALTGSPSVHVQFPHLKISTLTTAADHREHCLNCSFISDVLTSWNKTQIEHWNSFRIVSASLAYFLHVLTNMLMRLKQFQCFISVLFHDVRTSEIKLEIKLFYFSFISPCATGFSPNGTQQRYCYKGRQFEIFLSSIMVSDDCEWPWPLRDISAMVKI